MRHMEYDGAEEDVGGGRAHRIDTHIGVEVKPYLKLPAEHRANCPGRRTGKRRTPRSHIAVDDGDKESR